LVVADPHAARATWGEAASWRSSDVGGGSPGTGDSSDPGDLDADGSFDADDINLLVQGIRNGAADSAFDIDGSGVVDTDDILAWLAIAGNANIGTPYVPGDVDLNGEVDARDLNVVGIHWRQNVTGWSQADFNTDGVVNAADLNLVGINWRHGVAAAASFGRVPRAPLAAQSDTAHAVPADSVIPAEITTAATQRPMCIHAVTFPQGEERAIDRDEVATRYRIRGDAHRPVSDRQEESDRKDAFTELADDIFAAW
jgi:hypothetical protein